MESYRITVPLDPVEDKEIIDRMPKWARGNWIREQVKKAITMQGSSENGDLQKLVEEYLQQQGSVTQNQVRSWIAEALQQLPSTTGDQVQEIVTNVLQKQMTITEQQVKLWVQEAVSTLQEVAYKDPVLEQEASKMIDQNDLSSITEIVDESNLRQNGVGSKVETVDESSVLKTYEVLQSEPVKQIKRRSVRRSIHDVVERRPTVETIETVALDRSVEENDEYAEYGLVDLTHLDGIDGFGVSEE